MKEQYQFQGPFDATNPLLKGFRKFATWRVENKFQEDFEWDISFFINDLEEYKIIYVFKYNYWIRDLDLKDGFFYERYIPHGTHYRIDEEFDLHHYDADGLITNDYGYKQIYKPKETQL